MVCSQGPRDRAVASSRNRKLGHSRNSAAPPPRLLLLGADLVGTAILPCHFHQASSPQASKASERVRAGSSFMLSSTAPLLSEPQAPHVPGSWGLAKPPNSARGLRPSPSQMRPWTPSGGRHTPLARSTGSLGRGGGGTKRFRHGHPTTPDTHPLTRTAWEGPPLTPENSLLVQPGLTPRATRYQANSGVCLPATHPSGDHEAASLKAEDQRELRHRWPLRALKCPRSRDLIPHHATSDPGAVLRS